MNDKTHEQVIIKAIVANCHRLLRDAHHLLSSGSPGAALSLAILAFEEAGKGHQHELGVERTKRTSSWHHFRQFLTAYVLFASMAQKYGLNVGNMSPRARELLNERHANVKSPKELVDQPIPEELRREMALSFDLSDLGEKRPIFIAELNWTKKIIFRAARGDIEVARQRGIYVDVTDGDVSSDPSEVTSEEAYYWIRVAERALAILEFGDFKAPYGELAAYLESLPTPLPTGDELSVFLDKLMEDTAQLAANLKDNK